MNKKLFALMLIVPALIILIATVSSAYHGSSYASPFSYDYAYHPNHHYGYANQHSVSHYGLSINADDDPVVRIRTYYTNNPGAYYSSRSHNYGYPVHTVTVPTVRVAYASDYYHSNQYNPYYRTSYRSFHYNDYYPGHVIRHW